jgi:hypothetical protein
VLTLAPACLVLRVCIKEYFQTRLNTWKAREAYKGMKALCDTGYSAIDIITTVYRVRGVGLRCTCCCLAVKGLVVRQKCGCCGCSCPERV